MWTRFKGQVLRGKEEKDLNDEDTLVTRALLRYYEPEIPGWLLPPGSEMRERLNNLTLSASREPGVAAAPAPSPVMPQPFVRRESAPRLFDRHDQPLTGQSVSPPTSRSSTPGSGLASRLKNTRW